MCALRGAIAAAHITYMQFLSSAHDDPPYIAAARPVYRKLRHEPIVEASFAELFLYVRTNIFAQQ